MQIAATRGQRFSTFLLEMALDEARMRKHLAERLLAERTKRGHGEARRFPQPEMARAIGVSGRAYQGWEGEERLPNWRNLEKMADYFETTTEDLLGSHVTEADLPVEPEEDDFTPTELARLEERLAAVERKFDDLQEYLRRKLG